MEHAISPDDAAMPLVDLLLTEVGKSEPNGELVQYGNVLPWL